MSSSAKFLSILEEMKSFLCTNKLSLPELERTVSKLLLDLTSSTWAEVLVRQNDSLSLVNSNQEVSSLPISESSLPGYCACHGLPQVINNSDSSPFYKAFETVLYPLSQRTLRPLDTSNLACVPISLSGQVSVVLMVFNKTDTEFSPVAYTDEDILAVQSVGLLMSTVLARVSEFQRMQKKVEKLKLQADSELELSEMQMQTVTRKIVQSKFKSMLSRHQVVNQDTVRVLADTMKADAVLLHTVAGNELSPLFSHGIDPPPRESTKTANYVGVLNKEVLVVDELRNEPLWKNSPVFYGKALLGLPVFNSNEEVVLVIEFFRSSKTFTKFDVSVAEDISRCLQQFRVEEDPEMHSEVNDMYIFSVSEKFNYNEITKELDLCAEFLSFAEECSIILVDQKNNLFWTQKSENCDALEYPIVPETLFGTAYYRQTPVIFPCKDISDSDIFNGKQVMCVPIIARNLVTGVIGLLVFYRSEKAFTEKDKETGLVLGFRIRQILENWFLFSLLDFRGTVVENTVNKSSSLSKKQANKEVKTQLSPLLGIINISSARMNSLKGILNEIKNDPFNFIPILSSNLPSILQCEHASLVMIDNQRIIDIETGELSEASGLVLQSIVKKEHIYVPSEASLSNYFDKYTDALGQDIQVNSFLAVPAVNFMEDVFAVLVFINLASPVTEEDLSLVQVLTAIFRDIIKIEGTTNVQDLIKNGRRHNMLQYWCKQIFNVVNSTQVNMKLAQSILKKLYESGNNLQDLITASIQVLCANINAEKASFIRHDGTDYVETTEEDITHSATMDDLLTRAFETMNVVNSKKDSQVLIVPYERDGKLFAIKIRNKRDETQTAYSKFTKPDEVFITELLTCLVEACQGRSCKPLAKLIRQRALSMNTSSLISTIRTAAQKLMDCDRATVFIREGKKMVLESQGYESEMREGLRIPIGKGIIGNVAQTGQVENIRDVYEDPRFNPEIDRQTGYKTSTMLCMPVLDSNLEVIAALQMINKRNGYFEKDDEQTLEILCEITATVLVNWRAYKKSIEENQRYLNMLNSIGNYIIAFSEDGLMNYSNKPLEDVFGIEEQIMKNAHYSTWLRQNRQLVYDLTTVLQQQQNKIRKTSQKVISSPLKRYRSTAPQFQYIKEKEKTYNYTIAGLHDYFNLKKSGIVLILEDASEIEELSKKFKKIKEEMKMMNDPVRTETPLQTCIDRLLLLSESHTEIQAELFGVVNILKQGDIQKARVVFSEDMSRVKEYVKSAIVQYAELDNNQTVESNTSKRIRSYELMNEPEIMGNLLKIELNVYEITDIFSYIYAMMQDFGLLVEFNIRSAVLKSFVEAVRSEYEVWGNPYHNFYHGFNVMHFTYMILAFTNAHELFGTHQLLALLIASLCHDVQHTGRTNTFEINRSSNLALLYNDKSVLENHHAAVTFKILQVEKNNIFSGLDNENYKKVRSLVVSSVLATDMAVHFSMIANMNARLNAISESQIGTRPSDISDFGGLVLHAADLGHTTSPSSIYKMWSLKVCEEFSKQYSEEVEFGLPPTELMRDLEKPGVYYDKEHGFLNYVALPLWDVMNKWLNPQIKQFIQNLRDNIQEFENLKEEFKDN